MVIHYRSSTGVRKVRGGPALKRSQVYPRRYGRKFQELHCKWVADHTGELRKALYGDSNDLATEPGIREAFTKAKTLSWWSHAQLEEVKVFLRRERDAGRFQPVFNDGLD